LVFLKKGAGKDLAFGGVEKKFSEYEVDD